jgi:hypothetical protein
MLAKSQTIVVDLLGGLRTMVTANPVILQDLLGKRIFNADDDVWRLQLKVSSYHFSCRSLCNFNIKFVGEVMNQLLLILHHASERGRCLDLQDILQRFTFDTICKVTFRVYPDPASLDVALLVSDFTQAFDVVAAPISWLWKIKKKINVGLENPLLEALRVVQDFAFFSSRKLAQLY